MRNILTIATADEPVTMETTTSQPSTPEVVVNGENGQQAAPKSGPGAASGQLILIGVMFVVMYFLLFRGPRKQQKEQAKMRSSLQKNDRVLTIGGIYGTILEVKDKEVTLKIDESNNTKMKVSLSAISSKIEK